VDFDLDIPRVVSYARLAKLMLTSLYLANAALINSPRKTVAHATMGEKKV
jgi:hypothetical protein